MTRLIACLLALVLATAAASADTLRLAVTTSFHNSGLSDVLLPRAREDIGLAVELLVVGTGQALRLGRAGDVDAILVHSKAAEIAFVEEGYGTHRREIMYNDFVLVGPSDDPAGAGTAEGIRDALGAVARAEGPFVSRGDDSGTHRRELALWTDAGVTPEGAWYREVGAGMGAALNVASAMDAYILSDRASWLNFQNKGALAIVFSGDPALFNQYAFLPVDPARHPHVAHDEAVAFEDWLVSPEVQELIGAYEIGGETLFVPNATAEAVK